MRIIMDEFDKIFLSYKKILNKFKMLNIKTKNGKEITHKDLRYAVYVMLKKHPTCRWRSEKILSRRYYILDEGYKWLRYVYFQNEKKQIDADIEFFENRIKQYEELLKVKHSENWWNEDMTIKQLEEYFNRSNSSIKKTIRRMCDNGFSNYKYFDNNKVIISSEGVEWISKNVFKKKYLELLEKYKMELTDIYIKEGYIYDEYFGRN